MPLDIQIKFKNPEVLGEGKVEPDHVGWIEGMFYSEGMTVPHSTGTGSGQATGRPYVHEFTFEAARGIHSVFLTQYMATNQHFGEVVIHFLKQLKDNKVGVYERRTYKKVMLNQMNNSKTNDNPMTERWQFAAAEVEWEYFKQDDAGDLVSAGITSWNQQASTA